MHVKFSILVRLFFAGHVLTMPTNAEPDVRIRIHAPFAERYANESDIILIRVENKGTTNAPWVTGRPDEDEQYPPRQIWVQTEAEAREGRLPELADWEEITRFSSTDDMHLSPSYIPPQHTVERVSRFTGVGTPAEGGRFRVLLQTGPRDFAASNWVERVVLDRDVPEFTMLEEEFGEVWPRDYALAGEEGKIYLWMIGRGPGRTIHRIASVPAGIKPKFESDFARRQHIVRFPGTGLPPLYYGLTVGVTKDFPFPEGHLGTDLIQKAHPIDSPSSLGFPLALFDEPLEEEVISLGPPPEESVIPDSGGNGTNPVEVDHRTEEADGPDWAARMIWISALLAIVAFILWRRSTAGQNPDAGKPEIK